MLGLRPRVQMFSVPASSSSLSPFLLCSVSSSHCLFCSQMINVRTKEHLQINTKCLWTRKALVCEGRGELGNSKHNLVDKCSTFTLIFFPTTPCLFLCPTPLPPSLCPFPLGGRITWALRRLIPQAWRQCPAGRGLYKHHDCGINCRRGSGPQEWTWRWCRPPHDLRLDE